MGVVENCGAIADANIVAGDSLLADEACLRAVIMILIDIISMKKDRRLPDTRKSSPFLESVRRAVRVRHYSVSTEKAYLYWVEFFIRYHRMRHPSELDDEDVAQFLSFLANERQVAASTQNQALNALVFLYGKVLGQPLGELQGVVRAKRPVRLPSVLSVEEVGNVLGGLRGVHWLVGCLLYGSGLRLMEAVRLRVKDLDFDHRALVVRDGKGKKDRVVTLADQIVTPLRAPPDQSSDAVREGP